MTERPVQPALQHTRLAEVGARAGRQRPQARGLGTLTALAALAAWQIAAVRPAVAADVDVGVSIQVSQPGVYGRIDIGRFPQPQVVVAQPVLVVPPRMRAPHPVQPVYLWVPPGHRKHWHKHCEGYGACGVPVVFVRDDWYQAKVMPHARGADPKGRGKTPAGGPPPGRGRAD